MKINYQKASHFFLMLGLLLLAISYFLFDFEHLLLNLLMYSILTVGFALNLIAVLRSFR